MSSTMTDIPHIPRETGASENGTSTSEHHFIREYAADRSWCSIPATFKLLYSDFIVIEIPEAGKPLSPSSSVGEEPGQHRNDKQEGIGSKKNEGEPSPPPAMDSELLQQIYSVAEGKEESVVVPTEKLTKEERRKIHEFVRQAYAGQLDSTTEKNGLVVKRMGSGASRSTKRSIWPADRPDFLHFTLTKENKDCHWAINLLSRLLHIRPQSFSMCGTKDRRAITTQRMCIYRVEKQRMELAAKRLRHGLWLSDFAYSATKLRLGSLWGNRFHIVLRDLQLAEGGKEELARRLDKWQRTGFLNYFGSQRFGTCGVNTAEVGKLILAGQWEKAVKELLKQRPQTHGRLQEALQLFAESGDPAKALRALETHEEAATRERAQMAGGIEASLLFALSKDPSAFKAAILALPRDTRSLYVHAYQSLLFNRVLSARVEKHGLAVLDVDTDREGRKLTPSQSIHDTFIPLPTAKSSTNEGEVASWYREFMKEDGVDPRSFSTLEKQFAVGDAVLRPMLSMPTQVTWELVPYDDPRKPIQENPFVPLRAEHHATITNEDEDDADTGSESEKNTAPSPHNRPPTNNIDQSEHHLALKLQFDLPSGCYATVALRELLHWEMDKEAQKTVLFTGH